MGLPGETKITKKMLRETMTRAQFDAAFRYYEALLKRQVEEDVADVIPPVRGTTEASAAASDPAPAGQEAGDAAKTPPLEPSNGQAELSPDERRRWGALSWRSMAAGLSPTTWEALRAGPYEAAERLIQALEQSATAGAA